MKNKFKVLATCLLAIGMVGAATACDQLQGVLPGTSTETSVNKYMVKFVNDDGSVISEVEYEEGAAIEVPADPTKAATDSYTYTFAGWDSEVATTATANVTYKATYTKTAIEYTVTFKADGVQVGEVLKYSADSKNIEAPAVPAKAHYTGVWESYTLNTGDKVVNAIYTPVEYTIVFKVNGVQYGQPQKYTIENQNITVPSVPTATEGYSEFKWEAYDLSQGGDIVVNLLKVPTVYNVTFKADGAVVGTDTYTVEDKDITVPAVPVKDGYTGAWETYTLTVGDVEVDAVYKLNEYSIKFMDGETLVEEVKFNKDNKGEKKAPAGTKVGYTANWSAYSFDTLADQTATLTGYTANTYTITFDANGGTCQGELKVTYDAAYTLPTATAPTVYQEFLYWKDAEGKEVKDGTWTIASDVTLTAVYTDGITFENMTEVPSYIKGDKIQSFAIVEMDGNKVLEAKTTNDSTSDVKVSFSLEFVSGFFKNDNIAYMAFDVKSGGQVTDLFASKVTENTQMYYNDGSWKKYEKGTGFTASPTDAFKTFYLPRSAYEAWVAANTTNPWVFMFGGGLVFGGQSFYIDNIRPVTEDAYAADWWSFEYGDIRLNNGQNPCYYHPTSTQWVFNLSNIDSTSVKFTNDLVSDGNRALMFTKYGTGETVISLNHTTDTNQEKMMREAQYISYDLYVPEGSDAKLTNNNEEVTRLAQGWNTIYVKVPTDTSINQISRFHDTTCSTYVIDNIRFLTEAEYIAKVYSFEAGAGALRDSSANDGNKAIYYWGAYDRVTSKFSMSITRDASVTLSNAHMDTEIVKDGEQSLSFHKTNGYLAFHIRNDMLADLKNGFTFWVYADLDAQPAINGVGTSNIVNGVNGKLNGGEGIIVKAREWTQITITSGELTADGRFLIIQGSTAGTYYFDGFQPLSAE